jgi:hypothetical protein
MRILRNEYLPKVSEGYHGTDINTALRIAEAGGFDTDRDTYFALPNDMGFAIDHGQKNGSRAKTDRFAVLAVAFPDVHPDSNEWGDMVRLWGDELGAVALRSMTIYNTETLEPLESRSLDEAQ